MTKPSLDNRPFALIIEDDPKLAIIFSKALEMAEFETETVEDGTTALERLAAIVPHVVVLDIHLPYISGEEILRKIRAEERLAQTEVIIVTADLYKADELRSQVNTVLVKPIRFKHLLSVVTQLNPRDTMLGDT